MSPAHPHRLSRYRKRSCSVQFRRYMPENQMPRCHRYRAGSRRSARLARREAVPGVPAGHRPSIHPWKSPAGRPVPFCHRSLFRALPGSRRPTVYSGASAKSCGQIRLHASGRDRSDKGPAHCRVLNQVRPWHLPHFRSGGRYSAPPTSFSLLLSYFPLPILKPYLSSMFQTGTCPVFPSIRYAAFFFHYTNRW